MLAAFLRPTGQFPIFEFREDLTPTSPFEGFIRWDHFLFDQLIGRRRDLHLQNSFSFALQQNMDYRRVIWPNSETLLGGYWIAHVQGGWVWESWDLFCLPHWRGGTVLYCMATGYLVKIPGDNVLRFCIWLFSFPRRYQDCRTKTPSTMWWTAWRSWALRPCPRGTWTRKGLTWTWWSNLTSMR